MKVKVKVLGQRGQWVDEMGNYYILTDDDQYIMSCTTGELFVPVKFDNFGDVIEIQYA